MSSRFICVKLQKYDFSPPSLRFACATSSMNSRGAHYIETCCKTEE